MTHLLKISALMAALWAAFTLLACGLTAALTGQWPSSFLSALYVACSGLLAASWAADVAVPAGVRHG